MNPGDWVRRRGEPTVIGVIIKTVCDPLDGRLYADVLWSSSRARKWRTPVNELEGVEEKESV